MAPILHMYDADGNEAVRDERSRPSPPCHLGAFPPLPGRASASSHRGKPSQRWARSLPTDRRYDHQADPVSISQWKTEHVVEFLTDKLG